MENKKSHFICFWLAILSTWIVIPSYAAPNNKIVISNNSEESTTVYIEGCKIYRRASLWTAVAPMRNLKCRFGTMDGEYYPICATNGDYDSKDHWVLQLNDGETQSTSRDNFSWTTKNRVEVEREIKIIEAHAKKFCSGNDGEYAAQSIQNAIKGRNSSRNNPTKSCSHHYIGKVIELKGGAGLTFPGEIRGIGDSVMTVRYNFLGEWKSAEFPCSNYP